MIWVRQTKSLKSHTKHCEEHESGADDMDTVDDFSDNWVRNEIVVRADGEN